MKIKLDKENRSMVIYNNLKFDFTKTLLSGIMHNMMINKITLSIVK